MYIVKVKKKKKKTTKHTVLFGQTSYPASNNVITSACNFQNDIPEDNYSLLARRRPRRVHRILNLNSQLKPFCQQLLNKTMFPFCYISDIDLLFVNDQLNAQIRVL